MRVALVVLIVLAVLAARLRAEEAGTVQAEPAGVSCTVPACATGGRA